MTYFSNVLSRVVDLTLPASRFPFPARFWLLLLSAATDERSDAVDGIGVTIVYD